MNKLLFHINAIYSALWIWATGTDKHVYREKSIIHNLIVSMYKY